MKATGVIIFAFLMAVSSVCHALQTDGIIENSRYKIGPGDFFPWGKEILFPWSEINGYHRGFDRSGEVIYYFNVRTQKENERILEIWQIDSKCKIVARGAGFEYNRVVRGVLTKPSGKSYEISVKAFNAWDVYPRATEGFVTVVSKSLVGVPSSQQDFEIKFYASSMDCSK
jgi:hypothetical protein